MCWLKSVSTGQPGVCCGEDRRLADGERTAPQCRWPSSYRARSGACQNSLQGEVRQSLLCATVKIHCSLAAASFQHVDTAVHHIFSTELRSEVWFPAAEAQLRTLQSLPVFPLFLSFTQDCRVLCDGVLRWEDCDCSRAEAWCQWGGQLPMDESSSAGKSHFYSDCL